MENGGSAQAQHVATAVMVVDAPPPHLGLVIRYCVANDRVIAADSVPVTQRRSPRLKRAQPAVGIIIVESHLPDNGPAMMVFPGNYCC